MEEMKAAARRRVSLLSKPLIVMAPSPAAAEVSFLGGIAVDFEELW